MDREKVRFASGDTRCAAWHYPGSTDACVIMAGGNGVIKEPGTDRFALRFAQAGLHVLAFDYRHFGESGGQPRQLGSIRRQLADWDAALAYAKSLPGVSPHRIVAWGFSSSGGHVIRVAARHPELAAAIAQTPFTDGPAVARSIARQPGVSGTLRLTARGILDALGGLVGRPPMLVPLAGPPGALAALTTPDSLDGDEALNPGNRYPDWDQTIAARSALALGTYRPGRYAARIRCPIQFVVADDDRSVLAAPAVAAAGRAPRGELVRLAGRHYAPFLAAHEQAVEAELDFLHRHVLDRAPERIATGTAT